jgi:Tfp pilus assembly protein PilW
MANAEHRTRSAGFSLVELLVALVFTMILMAGMATVFKATLTGFVTSGEKISSSRRNRMSLDLMYDDLNSAGMYLSDLANPPQISSTNEAFYILPDPKAQAGAPIAGVTQGADELYFYMDQPLPFEGILSSTTAVNASTLANSGSAAAATITYTIDCHDLNYALQVAAGQMFIFKDSWDLAYIASVTPPTSGTVTVTVSSSPVPNSGITGTGASGLPSKASHLTGKAGVVFFNPAQMVRYSIQDLSLDPASTTATTPCLVRDQGTYAGTGFVASLPQQIITENVTGFRVYLSADAGKDWVGGAGNADWPAIKTGLNAQLATSGRPGFTNIGTDMNWFRSYPVLVRADVTTRTATERAEYYTGGTNTRPYKEQVQSLVMVPRHFGLAMN